MLDSWIATEADLSGIGGPSDGWTWDCVFQEIDIASKKTLFEWRSLDHIAVNESYLTWSAALGGESKDSREDHCPAYGRNDSLELTFRSSQPLTSTLATSTSSASSLTQAPSQLSYELADQGLSW